MSENPYKSPSSSLGENNNSFPDIAISILIMLISIPVLFILVFPVTGTIKSYLESVHIINNMNERMVVDAILTFSGLIIYFTIIYIWRKKHAVYINGACAFLLFIYWGVESDFFTNGLSPLYPAWYEINMALNDIVAATLVFIAPKLFRSLKIKKIKGGDNK